MINGYKYNTYNQWEGVVPTYDRLSSCTVSESEWTTYEMSGVCVCVCVNVYLV